MARREPQNVPIVFNFPYEDEERMAKIQEAGKKLTTMKYQSAYDELSDDQKEIGFEILQRKFKEEHGEQYSLRIKEV